MNDRAALTSVVGLADLVGLSFVRSPADVDDLLREQLAITGRPTRAEITDAAMSDRAECVMLNHVVGDVVHRMRRQYKCLLLHPLTSWQRDP
jgi:pyruvate kinase